MKRNEQLREAITETIKKRKKREIQDRREGGWISDRAGFTDYEDYFSMDLGELGVREHLRTIPSPTVIDLMAPPNALADLFNDLPQTDKLGISVATLNYSRSFEQRALDQAKGIRKIVGDLLIPKTWEKINRRLNGRPVDLLVERGLSGIVHIPLDRDVYEIAARLIWEGMNPNGGIVLVQIPTAFQFAEIDVNLYGWVQKLKDNGIGAKYADSHVPNTGKLMIQRTPDSPARLPRF